MNQGRHSLERLDQQYEFSGVLSGVIFNGWQLCQESVNHWDRENEFQSWPLDTL